MELTEDEIIQKYAKSCRHCNQVSLLAYEYEWSCFLCNFVVSKRKHELSKIQRKKINFNNRLKYAEQKIFCICIDVNKIYGNEEMMIMMKYTKFY